MDERGEERFLTKSEAAVMLGITVDSLDKIIGRGELVAYKVGGAVRTSRANIEAYLQARTMGPGRKLRAKAKA